MQTKDYSTATVLRMCDNLFIFGKKYLCKTAELQAILEEELLRNSIKGMDVTKVLQILSENRGIVHKKAIRIGDKVISGYIGLEPTERAKLQLCRGCYD